ncbi:hypothetical protein FHW67_001502 [Herbaspirillum sp. Sphag1AN]|uniref:MerR family transcriptional regulator n=1 Tax=unclassified Herbaspirillum TaxID=2624150 RepID=UPI001611C793|nr:MULTISPECIES: MerR family transcriptional regulator [unclassified Herbaspirillum]MBB3212222.1 hypothetical protein [Herbaspirillum sp. Sphag1AN]MBB3245680.1 hypothetical protein [Herbaspirillum sp. Sphag64]
MPNQHSLSDTNTACYRSGAAARLTGVPVETLRVWERRYGVVGPRVTDSGQRLYTVEEVRRLGIIKQLVDDGHAIGSIATLPTPMLRDMVRVDKLPLLPVLPALAHSESGTASLRIVLVGPWLASLDIRQALPSSSLEVVATCGDLHHAARTLAPIKADIAVLEMPTLDDTSLATIALIKDACEADRCLVFYRFAPGSVLRRLRLAGHEVVHRPLDAVALEWFCHALIQAPQQTQIQRALMPATIVPPPPRFDDKALVGLAGISSDLYCECARHVVELIQSLQSFEQYSASCANRDDKDVALHRDLQWTTGHARAALEAALVRLAQVEGITVPMKDIAEGST